MLIGGVVLRGLHVEFVEFLEFGLFALERLGIGGVYGHHGLPSQNSWNVPEEAGSTSGCPVTSLGDTRFGRYVW
ncbi:hypothetical protein GCM10010448_68390 [Streptomyces glomeratus]|uniref:Uncharacterized protein n=1 Tax=Streptomyces glomeratus TaxID=284452 RepID=A0ABP6M4U0_9ACTN